MRRLLPIIITLLALACAKSASSVRDDLDRPLRVGEVRRMVTLAPSLTEIAFAIGAGDRVVATDDFSDSPAAARSLPKVGGVQPSVEKIVAAQPHLVVALAGSNHPVLASALDSARIPLFVARTERLEDVPRLMRRLGAVLGSDAEPAAARVERAVQRERRRRDPAPRVLFLVWTDPLYVAGRKTFAGDLIELAGAANSVTADGWPQYSLETVAAAPPDVILVPDRSVKREQIDELLERAPQLRASRLVLVNEDRFTRPGPNVAAAAADLNAILDTWAASR